MATLHPDFMATLKIMIKPSHASLFDRYGFLRLAAQNVKIADILRDFGFMAFLQWTRQSRMVFSSASLMATKPAASPDPSSLKTKSNSAFSR
ncbi:hypothetical protein [Bradyrhizobium australiense]|uniref:Uncharacterized protein n=1 Tax=Bradyrhizobium australiense TaxID=2721161 RepID=A0A7Y4GTC5_9BRAD|nr:hypothetical protein [Bradyrhizobium australiense]NOJ41516.1 hypothetical protein [Bradyrhizobium australiense]